MSLMASPPCLLLPVPLDVKQTETAIKQIGDFFQLNFD